MSLVGEFHKCFSVFLPLRWDRLTRVGWSWIFPFRRSVRLCFTSFSWGQALLRRTKFSGVFQSGSFFPHPTPSWKGFFSNFYCENLVRLLEEKLTILCPPPTPMTGSLEFLSVNIVCTEPTAMLSVTVQVFLITPCSCGV